MAPRPLLTIMTISLSGLVTLEVINHKQNDPLTTTIQARKRPPIPPNTPIVAVYIITQVSIKMRAQIWPIFRASKNHPKMTLFWPLFWPYFDPQNGHFWKTGQNLPIFATFWCLFLDMSWIPPQKAYFDPLRTWANLGLILGPILTPFWVYFDLFFGPYFEPFLCVLWPLLGHILSHFGHYFTSATHPICYNICHIIYVVLYIMLCTCIICYVYLLLRVYLHTITSIITHIIHHSVLFYVLLCNYIMLYCWLFCCTHDRWFNWLVINA